MKKNSSTIAIGMAIGILLALVVILLIKSFSRESLVSKVHNGKNVGIRAQHLTHSFKNFMDGTYSPQSKINTFKRFDIKMTNDDYQNWCRLRSALGGCEVLDSAGYSARGGACRDECAALGKRGG